MRCSEARTGRVFVIRLETGVDVRTTVGEVMLVELMGSTARRAADPVTGLALLEP